MASHPTLVIGDASAATTRHVAQAFETAGVQVVATCQDGLSLVEAVMEHRPSLVALDLVLPKLTGLQAIEALRRKGVAPIFVVASAVSTRERVLAAKEAGASFYILKPFDPARLAEAVSRLAKTLATSTR
jgi:two-component system chemotaxis response regulator CheY